MTPAQKQEFSLNRTLGISLLVFYGLGIIIGAGVYVVIGDVVAQAGAGALLSFALAGLLALLTALSYAELGSRYPEAAGAAAYVKESFNSAKLSQVTGFVVASVALITAATIAHGAALYAQVFIPLPVNLVASAIILLFTAIACLGVKDSVRMAAVMTFIELGGLLLVMAAGWRPVAAIDFGDLFLPEDSKAWSGILAGAFLAFFAFTGFENLANMAEEAEDSGKTVPYAILLSLAISTIAYMGIALIVIAGHSSDAGKTAALSLLSIVENSGWKFAGIFSVIALVAVSNGVLIQILMLARLFYGMASRSLLPEWLAHIGPRRIPVHATLLAGALVLLSTLSLPFESLLRLSTSLTLIVFALISLALFRLKLRQTSPNPDFSIPLWIPLVSFCGNAALIFAQFIG